MVSERGLDNRLLAWIYSADFPVRITSEPPVSLQGMTFVKNTLPEGKALADAIGKGRYFSPLFAGPDTFAAYWKCQSRKASQINNPPYAESWIGGLLVRYVGSRGHSSAHAAKLKLPALRLLGLADSRSGRTGFATWLSHSIHRCRNQSGSDDLCGCCARRLSASHGSIYGGP